MSIDYTSWSHDALVRRLAEAQAEVRELHGWLYGKGGALDAYNNAAAEVERLRAEIHCLGLARAADDAHMDRQAVVVDAARAFAHEIDTVGLGGSWQLVYDAVRALDAQEEEVDHANPFDL